MTGLQAAWMVTARKGTVREKESRAVLGVTLTWLRNNVSWVYEMTVNKY